MIKLLISLQKYSTPSIVLGLFVWFGFSSLPVRALEWEPALETETKTIKPNSTTVVSQDFSIEPSSALQSLDWTIVTPDAIESNDHSAWPAYPVQHSSLIWEALAPRSNHKQNEDNNLKTKSATELNNLNAELVWEAVDPGAIIAVDDQPSLEKDTAANEQSIPNALDTVEQNSATFANDRALWRNERWLPQISSDVPIGYGPSGIMTTLALKTIDCTTSGICRGTSDWNDYLDQIQNFGEAQYDFSLGFGDSENALGLIATFSLEETKIPLGTRNTQDSASDQNFLDEYYIGLHLARNIGLDTSVRVGINNWIDVKKCGSSCGFPKSAYGVVSQRIRLNANSKSWFQDAYLTLGAGNGEFRSVDQKFKASVAAQRAAGCWTYGYYKGNNCDSTTREQANNRSVSYGQLVPIGALAIEAYPGINLIGEWVSGNLNAGLSISPFKDTGIIFTSMWGSLIQNCDWGCEVAIPDVPQGVPLEPNLITSRAKWSFTASFNLKF